MFKSFGQEFKVGLFAIVAFATLGYMFFILSPDLVSNKTYKPYYTVLSNAAGIVEKTHVKTNGITIGKVERIDLEGESTRVDIVVDERVTIPVGSKMEIRTTGLLGDKHLEIVRAPSKGELIEEGGIIEADEEGSDLQALMNKGGEIADDIKKITSVLANVLGSNKGEQQLGEIVENIRGLTADLKATTATLKSVIGDREGDLQDIVTDVRDGIADLKEFSASLKGVLDQENQDRIDRILASFDETMVDVKGSAKNINLISEKVEKGEGTIGRLVNDDDTLAELEGAIKDIRKVLAPATKLKVSVDYHNEFRKDETSQHYFNLVMQTRPDRFYLLGLTDTTYDTIEETEEPIERIGDGDEDNPSTSTKRTIREKNALKFNLQFGKRWAFLAMRMGLFETTGGLAGDLYLFNDRFRLTVEAYEWDTTDKTIRRTAHVKAYASVLFYNHIYVLAGVDDPTRTDPETGKANKELNYFVGAGLNFNDEDLKAIFGTAALAL
jgi:phospholipid/cholesterol/gamma-HCH transport system substrate-binding protein